jgi:uncharacterized LabA/DUF88 family protein
MEILVDYNNILEVDRKKGVRYVSERILSVIGPFRLGERHRATIRLYDGWYEAQSPSRVAQEVSADVQANCPHTVTLVDGTDTKRLIVSVELAYSLRSDPTVHLWHTFRAKSPQSNVSCKTPLSAGCTAASCPLAPMERFIAKRKCPVAGCSLKPQDFLVRNEQKLIDTMMAADLFSLHLSSAPEAVIVSSDDDLLPVIRMIAKSGTNVLHVLTRPPNASLAQYVNGLDANTYTQLQL